MEKIATIARKCGHRSQPTTMSVAEMVVGVLKADDRQAASLHHAVRESFSAGKQTDGGVCKSIPVYYTQ